MKNKKYWVLAAILVIFANIIWATNKTDSQTSPQITPVYQRDTLKGLQGVEVVVENVKPEVEKYGLTTQQLQIDVELQLRQSGIKVLSEQESLLTAGCPCLYLNVNVVTREDTPVVVYNISLKLKQGVFLARDITKFCVASTWEKGGETGRVGLNKIETIREFVKDTVDKFINDYLAVNPKE